jgi:hypothetical protein
MCCRPFLAEMVSQVIDLVDNLPAEHRYEYFKTQLLDIHQLSDYKKFDMLTKMETMKGRKQSQLLHTMLECVCPVGMEKHLSFHYFFMQRLPQALRTKLGEVQPGDLRALAARADKLWSVHSTVKGGTVAAAEAEETAPASIAAVRGGIRGRGGKSLGRGGARGAASGGCRSYRFGCPCRRSHPSDLARVSSGLCHFHWEYEEKAGKCVTPCSWGN